ncbi:MAG: nucleotidyl transferase AbiEii/AbiGii toxin family protein [Pseudonocardiaceae bacterium]
MGARLARDRKRVAFDRLLSRLVVVAPDAFVLKGGFALDLRLTERARTTKDIDLDWQRPDDELLDTLLDAADHDIGDFFTFSIERGGPPEDRLGGSRRFRVSATLAGREFETFLLDIGFRLIPTDEVEVLTTPDLLAFADVAPVTVPAIPLATQVAEKLHAYTRTYPDARPSSRTKDLVDLVLIAERANLDAVALRRAIETTFAVRGTHPAPETLPAPPSDWTTPFAELAGTVGITTDLTSAHITAAGLLDRILDGQLLHGTWNTAKRQWI